MLRQDDITLDIRALSINSNGMLTVHIEYYGFGCHVSGKIGNVKCVNGEKMDIIQSLLTDYYNSHYYLPDFDGTDFAETLSSILSR